LAALGTIADVVPPSAKTGSSPGTASSAWLTATDRLEGTDRAARLESKKLDSEHVGYWLAPRLKRGGAHGHAREASSF
jgi:single-stranded DNA-specific DHH superfamily exonuclease